MPVKLILILCIIFTLNGAYALAFDEKIQLNGDGKLVCRTDAQVARDQIDASGSQSYHRVLNLDTENKTASLKSIYSLNKPNGNESNTNSNNNRSANETKGKALQERYPELSRKKTDITANISDVKAFDYEYLPIYRRSFRVKDNLSDKFDVVYNNSEDLSRNRYGIMMIDPNSLEHGAFVMGADHFSANNTISFNKGKVNTKYRMSGSGLLKGSVIESDTMRRPHYLAETQIRDSNFAITSGLENKAKFGKKTDDRETLSEKLDNVTVGSKKEIEAEQKPDLNDRYAREIIGSNKTGDKKPQVGLSFNANEIKKADTGVKLDLGDDKTGQYKGSLDSASALVGAKLVLDDEVLTQNNESLNASEAQNRNTTIPSNSDSLQHNGSINAMEAQTGKKLDLNDDKKKTPIDNPKVEKSETINSLKIGLLTEQRGGTIIPASAFGSSINSTYRSPNAVLADSTWGMAYIGDYQPGGDSTVYQDSNFSVNLTKGMYVITKNKPGIKQRYLKIGSSGGQIKIRETPAGTQFDIFEDVAE
jgi:hypothetical protein